MVELPISESFVIIEAHIKSQFLPFILPLKDITNMNIQSSLICDAKAPFP